VLGQGVDDFGIAAALAVSGGHHRHCGQERDPSQIRPREHSTPRIGSDDVTALLCGSSQIHLGTLMPSGGGHVIRAA
jgi:hypothetical protein